MNIMIRDPYYLAKTVLGSYNLYILKDPFGSWHYSCVGTFNTKDEAIDYYHNYLSSSQNGLDCLG